MAPQPRAEALQGAQAQGLSDRIGDVQGSPESQVEHGGSDQFLVRHAPQRLQEQGAGQNIDGHIPAAPVLAEKRPEDALIDTGEDLRRKSRGPGLLQGLFFLVRQILHPGIQAQLLIGICC